jgi:hypothetical protein
LKQGGPPDFTTKFCASCARENGGPCKPPFSTKPPNYGGGSGATETTDWPESQCDVCLDATGVAEYERRQEAAFDQAYRNLPAEDFKKTRFTMKLCETHRKEYDAIHGTTFME